MIPDVDTRKPDVDPQKVEVRAQYLWLARTSELSLPSWGELSEDVKQGYRQKAIYELRYEL